MPVVCENARCASRTCSGNFRQPRSLRPPDYINARLSALWASLRVSENEGAPRRYECTSSGPSRLDCNSYNFIHRLNRATLADSRARNPVVRARPRNYATQNLIQLTAAQLVSFINKCVVHGCRMLFGENLGDTTRNGPMDTSRELK